MEQYLDTGYNILNPVSTYFFEKVSESRYILKVSRTSLKRSNFTGHPVATEGWDGQCNVTAELN